MRPRYGLAVWPRKTLVGPRRRGQGLNKPDCHSVWAQTLTPAPGLKPLGEHTADWPHSASSPFSYRRRRSPLFSSFGHSRPSGRMVQVVVPPTDIRLSLERLRPLRRRQQVLRRLLGRTAPRLANRQAPKRQTRRFASWIAKRSLIFSSAAKNSWPPANSVQHAWSCGALQRQGIPTRRLRSQSPTTRFCWRRIE